MDELDSQSIRWHPATRVLFRFAFAFFVLINAPFPLDYIPGVGSAWMKMWQAAVPVIAERVFRVKTPMLPNGSGDTTWNWVQIATMLAVALLVTIVWSVLDRRRTQYTWLHEALRIYVRFALALTMIFYGMDKVMVAQFPPPSLEKLAQLYGDSSPMGVLWAFMGYSNAYQCLTGLVETVAGILLTFRRTTLLGACVSIIAMTNVVALNFFFDVPVKIYSSELLLMAVFLTVRDLPRLARFFLDQPADAPPPPPLRMRPWVRLTAIVVRNVLIALYIYQCVEHVHDIRKYMEVGLESPLRGVWNVDELVFDGKPRPPLTTDFTRWRRVVIDRPGFLSIYSMEDKRQRFTAKVDEKKQTIDVEDRDNASVKFTLHYQRPARDVLVLDTNALGHAIHATCRRRADQNFFLVTRGFHWVNEQPLNR
ncbi:MAG: hypothetical protein JO197_09130 [Acidobacteria bacterium]|nr:hypothetical protein [Acidobacteriota bacterium]MBV9477258.1 hypothetical protein [Acidobacteriota bacterium]